MIPSIINATVLIAISAIHFYWAMGGKWAGDRVFPEIKSSKPIRPTKLITAVVAFVFLGFALIYVEKTQLVNIALPSIIEQYGVLVLGVIFIFRAIGEFKYLGFTKTIKDSKFAEMDTKYYSPLCLLLGINSFIINYL
jgi:hypothetical protein